jgi:hypothetical protein
VGFRTIAIIAMVVIAAAFSVVFPTASYALRPFDACVAQCMRRHCPQQTEAHFACEVRVRGDCISEARQRPECLRR